MNDQEKNILEYLENSYTGARMMSDVSAMVRIGRAIIAFKVDPEIAGNEIFTDKLINEVYEDENLIRNILSE